MKLPRTAGWMIAVTALTALAGCSKPVVVPATELRPATNPSSVALYDEQPGKYEILGVVHSDGAVQSGPFGEIDPIIEDLKAKAAKLGANGLLLEAAGSPARLSGSHNGVNRQVPIDKVPNSIASATAIYVIK